MTAPSSPQHSSQSDRPQALTLAIDLISTPSLAFASIRSYPSFALPLFAVLLSSMAVTGWYFSILDFSWYIDDTLARVPDLQGSELEEARQGMQALSQRGMAVLGMLGSPLAMLVIYLLQSTYLSLVTALGGFDLRFRQWFSLVAWAGLPNLFLSLAMAATILLNPDGQLSNFDLNPLSFYSIGMQTSNPSLNQVLAAVNLVQLWSLCLLTAACRSWLAITLPRAVTVVFAPYLLIFGVWTYFALT
ncbi:MAG: YIP1 family protein [Gammaproteobacteria bacterium]|nr:YIP1 family protein [Pseudomonadales bacterium]MCP5345468.1 YIP1 family protein [Pseudomonadales bacterium]